MLTLVSADLTPAAADALARERSWELRRVRRVSAAVAEMPPAERASVGVLIVEAEPVNEALLSQLSGLHLIACLRGDPVNVDVAAETIKNRGFIPTPLPELLPIADVVSLHARSASIVIGRDELARMKPGSILINTARATVLDYDALADSLRSGHLRAAALDVFPEEPIPAGSPLLDQPNVTLTPHLAGATFEIGTWQSEILLAAIRGIYTADGNWDELPVRNPELRAAWARRHVAGD